jgi:hypothetical protein
MSAKRSTPEQVALIADAAIKPLESLAKRYREIRDERITLTSEEVELKAKTLAMMHKYHKAVYRRDGIEIRIEPGEESIKVKVHREDEPSDDRDDGDATVHEKGA